jgi:hypothetical protein
MSSMLGAGSAQNVEVGTQVDGDNKEQEIAEILSSKDFRDNLFKMERVINLNSYQSKQALYRGFEIFPGL